jgi:hypothetical protein
MRRIEPPQFAKSMLENLTPSSRGESLAGTRQQSIPLPNFSAPPRATNFALLTEHDHSSESRFITFLVTAGLINALIVAWLLCRLPASQAPSNLELLIRAILYVSIGALAGTFGSWFYWRRPASPFRTNPPIPFRLFALISAAAWVWIPSILLFSAQNSPVSSIIAIFAAALLATGLRRTLPPSPPLNEYPSANAELFAQTLYSAPRPLHGYVIAACIYTAGLAYAIHESLTAAIPLALCAFLFAWNRILPPAFLPDSMQQESRAKRRLTGTAPLAILVTLFALVFGVAARNRAAGNSALAAAGGSASSHGSTRQSAHPNANALNLDGYESIVLWPEPPKKQIVTPQLPTPTPVDQRLTKPLVIRFDGAYWFFQPPALHPGPHAHITHGSPLAADIHSTTFIPLTMQAHQTISPPLRLSCCREIRVQLQNRDNRPGALVVALLLSDSTSHNKTTLYLGQQPIVSSQPGHFAIKPAPVTETLSYQVPARAIIRQFDTIDLVVMSDMARLDKGSRIAIDQFALTPR